MNSNAENQFELSPRRLPSGLTPPGCRMLHIPIREDVFRRAKAQALLSAVRFPEYVARLLLAEGTIPEPPSPEKQAEL